MTESDFASYIKAYVCLATFCGCLPVLLYGCEIWQMSSSDKCRLRTVGVVAARWRCVLVGGRVRTSEVFVETFFDVIVS